MSTERKLLASSGVLSFFTLVSRISGLLRDIMIAALLGVSTISDVFWLAFAVPKLARNILGEGALSTFVVPVFVRRRHESNESSMIFASRLVNIIALASVLLAAGGIIFSEKLFLLFGGYGILANARNQFGVVPPHIASLVELGGLLTRIMFPYLALLAVAAVLMGICNGLGYFARPALGGAMLNAAMLAAGAAALYFQLDSASATVWLAAAVLVGAALRIVILIPVLRKAGWRWRTDISFKDAGVRDVLRMMTTGLYGISLSHISFTLSGVLAAFAGAGVKTYLIHGTRLISLPMALTSAAMATAMLPKVTSLLVRNERAELSALIGFSRRVDLFVMMPAALGLVFFGLPIVELLFQRGAWTAADSMGVYWVLVVMAPSLLILGSIRLIVPLFYARQDAMTPVRTATVALGVTLLTGAFATFVLDGRQIGLAVGNLLGTMTNYHLLRRRIQKDLGPVLSDKSTTEAFLKCFAAGVIAIGVCALGYGLLAGRVGAVDSAVARSLRLLPMIGLSAILYLLLARAFNVPDSERAFEIVRRRVSGRWSSAHPAPALMQKPLP